MDPKIQEIITLFKQLDTTTSARRTAYHKMIDELGPDEWRDVKERINERSFQKDILGSLPLELAVQIIQYLKLDELHLLRRVSKRWHKVLSSKSACSILYRLYTGASLTDDFQSTLARYSRKRLRLEQGNPSTLLPINLSHLPQWEIDCLYLSNGKFVWLTDYETTITVYDTKTGKKQRFCTEHRERIGDYRLSSNVVAAFTMQGYCHAWDLQTGEEHTFRIPNPDVCLFYTHGFRIALYYEDHCEGSGQCGFIMHFDLQSKRSHSIQHVQQLALVSLETSSRYLTTICLGQEEGAREAYYVSGASCLCIVNYELHEDGTSSTACSYTRELPLPRDRPWGHIGIQHDMQDSRRKRIAFLYAQSAGEEARVILPVTYQPQSQWLCMHMLREEHFDLDAPPWIINVDNDILYWVRADGDKRSIWVSMPYAEPSLYAAQNMNFAVHPSSRATLSAPYVLLGDSCLVTMISTTSTQAWCFEDAGQLEEKPSLVTR
ncbi:F-box domain protein [Aspergillus undulatus]|uniref:F-box domain protein n=1 Tax=Aspergillus undulatus TaxID=1810928 RepID=UPI003CCCA6A8